MGTTTERSPAERRPGGRLRPKFDHLEFRMALSGSSYEPSTLSRATSQPIQAAPSSPYLSIVSTTPGESSVVTTSPTTLEVTFDRPVDDFTLGGGDFQLVHVASDGSKSPLSSGEAQLIEGIDPSDPSGRRVSLTLSKGLAEGHYELLLDLGNMIQGLDGSSLAPASSAQILSDFTFNRDRDGLATANDLGMLGAQESVVPGVLDLAKDPGAVRYYRFEVAPGHHWLVGLEVSSHRDGGTLDSSVSVFDSRGHLIATANQGLPADPNDPYLFAGLDPGTYYVGISASTNTPDASGAYNPKQTVIDSADAGGPFRLHLIANPADQPTRLLGLQVDHADPLSTMPTGLTLQFSGGLGVASLENPSQPALALVDRAGKAWSLTPIGYDSATGQLSLAFDQALPVGSYTLELTAPNSLVDLAGRAPVAQGLPAGMLGSFAVAQTINSAGDLGPIFPGSSAASLVSKVEVAPGGATSETFVILEGGTYSIGGVSPASGVRFSIQDQSGHILTTGPSIFGEGKIDVNLKAGVYQIVLTTDSAASGVSLAFRQKQAQFSSLLDSGVAQGAALNLRLVTPQANFGQTGNPSTTSAVQAPTNTTANSASGGSANSGPTVGVGLAIPGGPSIANFLSGVGPVGRPSLQADQISVVGISGPSGLATIASNSVNLPAGLIAAPVAIDGGDPVELETAPAGSVSAPEGVATPKSGITMESGLLARSPGSRREDDRALTDAEWIGQLVSNTLGRLGNPLVEAESDAGDPGMISDALGSPIDREASRPEESRLETASMTSPLGIGVVLGTIAFGYHRRFMGAKSSPATSNPGSKGPRPLFAGPHRRSRVRVR